MKPICNTMKRNVYYIFILAFIYSGVLSAQNMEPVNTNYLIEHGVSPRVLDAAASVLLQDGSFSENLIVEVTKDGNSDDFRMQMIYDPEYKYGMDIRAVVDKTDLSNKTSKKFKDVIAKEHHFSRMSRHYLYDESTLKMIKNEGGEVVFEYYYQKKDIEPYLKDIKRSKGNIYFIDGIFDRVVLTNFKPLKSGITNFESTVKYKKSDNTGGYIVSSIDQKFTILKGKDHGEWTAKAVISEYRTPDGTEISWEGKEDVVPLFTENNVDTISTKLG